MLDRRCERARPQRTRGESVLPREEGRGGRVALESLGRTLLSLSPFLVLGRNGGCKLDGIKIVSFNF